MVKLTKSRLLDVSLVGLLVVLIYVFWQVDWDPNTQRIDRQEARLRSWMECGYLPIGQEPSLAAAVSKIPVPVLF